MVISISQSGEEVMSDWIEINLPWFDETNHGPEYLKYPDFSAQIREIFGSEYEELNTLLTPYDNPHSAEFLRIRGELDDSGVEDIEQALIDLHNPSVDLVLRWRKLRRQVSDWESIQPETIEVERLNSAAAEEYYRIKGTISFRHNNLCRPGVLIEAVNSKGEAFQLLIGDINTAGGVCNDCSGINDEDIVKRCRVVWTSEKEKKS